MQARKQRKCQARVGSRSPRAETGGTVRRDSSPLFSPPLAVSAAEGEGRVYARSSAVGFVTRASRRACVVHRGVRSLHRCFVRVRCPYSRAPQAPPCPWFNACALCLFSR
ncbi:hypothetical protein MRX96_000128 [Rhipicephalus microplus]